MTKRKSNSGDNKPEKTPNLETSTFHRQQEACNAANNFTNKLAQTVKQRRQKLGLTQEELVSILQSCGIKVSQGYISLLEAGERKDPNVQLLVALAVLLDISLDKVLHSVCNGDESD